jgi:exodeoxyribonuclease VIII
MEWGTAVHTAVLEPQHLDARYPEDPQSPKVGGYPAGWRNTKDYKQKRAALLDRPGVEGLLTAEERQSLHTIDRRVRESEIGESLHELKGIREASVWGFDSDHDLWRKCRPDWYIPAANLVVDVKTAQDHRPRGFSRACLTYGYHMAAAYYIDTMALAGLDVEHYVFLVVNADAPHEVASYTLDEDSIEQGRADYIRELETWSMCVAFDNWPACTPEIRELRIPEYAITYTQEIDYGFDRDA